MNKNAISEADGCQDLIRILLALWKELNLPTQDVTCLVPTYVCRKCTKIEEGNIFVIC